MAFCTGDDTATAQAFRAAWFMGKFGGPSPKKHLGWSNDEEFMAQIIARGGFAERQAFGESKLVKKSSKSDGTMAFTGCKKLLKQSQ